ncbi:MAG TPA: glycosyltransferase family 39 protein, partial [Phycisphaerae bacterium]|nr:glycosyltransferase family 39 protein [Phycisphaerae bacterium]
MAADVTTGTTAARPVLAIFGLALALRWAWILVHTATSAALTFPDEEQYWRLAQSLAGGRGLVDEFGYRATFMPLYPAFLSLFADRPHGMLLARLVQAIVGAAAVFPIYVLARRLAGRRAAAASAMLIAADPFLVFGFSNLLLTETSFTTMLCAALAAGWPDADTTAERTPSGSLQAACRPGARRRPLTTLRALITGVLFATAVYLRPSIAAFIPLWLIALVLVVRPAAAAVRSGMVVAATVILLLLPWAVRNRIVLGQWVWLTTRSGISLYDGLGPRATGASDLAYTKTMPNLKGLSETQWDAYFTHESWRIARDDPARALALARAKFGRMWSFVPNEPGSRTPLKMAVSAVWMTLVLATAIIGAFRIRRGRDILLLLLPAVYLTLLHMIYVGSVRYRVPAMPLIYVLSGWAIARRWGRDPRGARDG